jgi:SWIM/SEC-C metal-binding protein
MAKLGSKKRPVVVRVKTLKRAEEIIELGKKHHWEVIAGVEPDKSEDISDVKKLLSSSEPKKYEIEAGRNDPCPCGSGLKFKKCCLIKTNEVDTLIEKHRKKWWHIWK